MKNVVKIFWGLGGVHLISGIAQFAFLCERIIN